jgi:acyl-CoA synthetase (AMP-forming)/AMP-acid ligase II
MPASSPPATSLLALAERNAARHPDALAVAGPRQRLTWSGLMAYTEHIAATIATRNLRSGDRVCLCLPSSPWWVASFLALRRLGLTAVSIGDKARPAELRDLVSRFDVRLMIGDGLRTDDVIGGPDVLDLNSLDDAPLVPQVHHEAALIHITSGSSGVPKGVLRTEADLMDEARNVAAALGLTPDDAVLCATPVYHSFASGLLLACLYAGAPCLLMDRLAPATLLDLALRQRATVIASVPYVFQTLTSFSSNRPLPSLRLAISGGAHLHPDVASRFRERFGAPLVQEYGLSEAGIVTLNLDGPAGSAGAPIPNVAIDIIDPVDTSRVLPSGSEGEVVLRRAYSPAGYLDHPDETAATFTPYGIRTGDLGRLDAEGRLTLTGRIKSTINVAGAKVAPREVEDALVAHSAVREAVAFSVPDEVLGEAVAAVVVLLAEARIHSPDIDPTGAPLVGSRGEAPAFLIQHCRGLLSSYKIPAAIRIVPELPRTASGKPDLPRIRQDFISGGSRERT